MMNDDDVFHFFHIFSQIVNLVVFSDLYIFCIKMNVHKNFPFHQILYNIWIYLHFRFIMSLGFVLLSAGVISENLNRLNEANPLFIFLNQIIMLHNTFPNELFQTILFKIIQRLK